MTQTHTHREVTLPATIPHRVWDINPIVTSRRGLGNPSQNNHKYSTHASPPVIVESCRHKPKRRNLRNHQEESGWKEISGKMKVHFTMKAVLGVTKLPGWCQLAILLFFLEIGSTHQRKFEILFSCFLRYVNTIACIPIWSMKDTVGDIGRIPGCDILKSTAK